MRRFGILAAVTLVASSFVLACSSDPAAPEDQVQNIGNEGGSGGASGQAGAGAGGGTAGTAGNGGDSGAGGGTAGASGEGGSGGTSATPSYPEGPYGTSADSTLQDFKFKGWMDPKAANFEAGKLVDIAMHDFYNPTGDTSRPRALLVTASARWCGVCKYEAGKSMGAWKHWNPKGVQFLTTVFENEQRGPSKSTDLAWWGSNFGLEYPIALDPALSLGVFFDKSAAPFNMVIDLTTMKIRYASTGAYNVAPDNSLLQELTAAK